VNIDDLLCEEVDDSCALCGIRGIGLLTIHHIDRDPSHNEYDNKIVLCHNCHQGLHDRKRITDEQVRERKRHLIHKTLTRYGVNALKIGTRTKSGVVAYPFLLYHLLDLGYMKQEETVMEYGPDAVLFGEGVGFVSEDFDEDATVDRIPAIARFSITASGRALVSAWF
jgi:hypothetical protein